MTTIIGWHVGDVGPRLAREVGWRYIAAPSPTVPVALPPGRVVLLGYSLGCVGLRETLRDAKTTPEVVATIDGTHSHKAKGAPVHPQHAALWRDLAAKARAGECLWLATTLGAHRYTERLPGAQAFASTGRVLEAALGLPDGVLREAQAIDDGGLHVRSYPSADCDTAAHAAQVREVLPALWAEIVAPRLAGRATLPTIGDHSPTLPPEPHGHTLPARPLGDRIADVALEYLARGVVEVPGPGSNPQIGALLYPCRRGGSPVAGILDATGARILGDRPADSIAWCAGTRSLFVFLAGDWTSEADRAACPHGYRCAVREHCEDARKLGTLRPADGSYVPRPGDAAVFTRGGANPLLGGEGHISTVVVGGLTFDTVGGNEADALRRSTHRVGEPGLVAFITTG